MTIGMELETPKCKVGGSNGARRMCGTARNIVGGGAQDEMSIVGCLDDSGKKMPQHVW